MSVRRGESKDEGIKSLAISSWIESEKPLAATTSRTLVYILDTRSLSDPSIFTQKGTHRGRRKETVKGNAWGHLSTVLCQVRLEHGICSRAQGQPAVFR